MKTTTNVPTPVHDEITKKFIKNATSFLRANPDVLADIQEKLLAFGKATHAERHNLVQPPLDWEILDGKSVPSFLRAPIPPKNKVVWHWFLYRDQNGEEKFEQVPNQHLQHRTEFLDGLYLSHIALSKIHNKKEHIAVVACVSFYPIYERDSKWDEIKATMVSALKTAGL